MDRLLYFTPSLTFCSAIALYDLYGYQSESVINDIIDQFEKYLNFVNVSPNILPWRMQQHDDDITLEQGSVFDK